VKLLRRAGQPQQRTRAWTWCVRGKGNRHAADVAELGSAGAVELVASTARGRSASGVSVSDAASTVGAGRPIGGGLILARTGPASYVYALRAGRVSAVGVARPSLARHPRDLRAAMRRALAAHASQAKPRYLPSTHARASRLTGTNLAGSSDPRLNRALLMLCHLNR
jgi:hypothetical protein